MAAWNANSGEVSHGDGGRNDEYMLTTTQLTRLNGGGGRGDHDEALGELGNAFLQRRGSLARAKARPAMADGCGSALRAVKAKEKRIEQVSASGRRWPFSRARTRDVVASAEHERHAVTISCAGRPQQL